MATTQHLPLQPASLDIWKQKYQLRKPDGSAIDRGLDDTYRRVAQEIANVEKPSKQQRWFDSFLWALENGAIPAGRIMANAGAKALKPSTSTINCTVSGRIHDSMKDILQKLMEAGLTLKAGSGIGYDFSTLRPHGAYVSGSGATTSGPLSFMDIYDKMCFTISSAGGRRGAQMATLDISHPDVVEFISSKRENGRLRQFNLSLLISDDFINAVKTNSTWYLYFPITRKEAETNNIALDDPKKIVWKNAPQFSRDNTTYIFDDNNKIACKIYREINAAELWDLVMQSNYDFAEPGFILIDRVNFYNNNWFDEEIRATNPCGEQPLPPYGSCLLGSINLTHFVNHPFTNKATFDWPKFRKVVSIFTRMLDNVVEIHGLALPQQKEELLNKRRHGMGFLGLGSCITMLNMVYGDKKSIAFTENVSKELVFTGWREALSLAKEKGPAPFLTQEYELTADLISKRSTLLEQGYALGDKVPGRILHAKHSHYMARIEKEDPKLIDELAEVGARFTHHSSIAPTGTIALSLGNNVSNGIEPSFAHHYSRNVIRPGRNSKEKVDVYSYEFLLYKRLVDPDANVNALPENFIDSNTITPQQHIDIQAAAQQWMDSSISKTINVATDINYADFKDIYLKAYEKGLKGCTTFRFNPEAFQGVLVRDQDLKNTQYAFTLEDGEIFTCDGNTEIEYEGQTHTAANLHDAIKEGYYGKV